MKIKLWTTLAFSLCAYQSLLAQERHSSKNPFSLDVIQAKEESVASQRNNLKGEDLHRRLTPQMFLAYVIGVTDVGTMMPDEARRYCLPVGVTNGQMQDVVAKYLTENPEVRHLGAAYLVRQALHEVWPCAPKAAAEKPPTRRAPNM